MKQKLLITFVTIIFLPLLVWGYYFLNYDLERVQPDGGELIASSISPNGQYTVKAFKGSGGATGRWTVKGEVQNNVTLRKRVIYWNETTFANITWENETTVIINEQKINVIKGSYDYRHD